MRLHNIAIALATVGLLVTVGGCEKEIPFDIDDADVKTVVNCLFDTDSTWVLEVSKSRSILDEDSELSLVSDATVRIYNPDGSSELLSHLGEGLYGSDSKPERGSTYSLEVAVPGQETVTASNSLNSGAEIVRIDTGSTVIGGWPVNEVTITLKDVPNIDNFYNIKLRSNYWEWTYNPVTQDVDSGIVFGNVWFTSADAVFGGGGGGVLDQKDFGPRGASFNDELFSGEERSITLSYYNWDLEDLSVTVSSGSEDFFLYERTFDLYQQTSDNPFAQPVQVYSNIENGLGIFAGMSSVTEVVPLGP